MGGNKIDWSPLSQLCRRFFKIDIEREPPLQRAFKKFGLDPNEPEDWKVCCARLARMCFSPKEAGQPKKWDHKNQLILIGDYITAMGMMKDSGDTNFFRKMRTHEEFGERYKNLSDGSIKSRVNEALNDFGSRGQRIKLLARAHRARTKHTRNKLIEQLRASDRGLSNE